MTNQSTKCVCECHTPSAYHEMPCDESCIRCYAKTQSRAIKQHLVLLKKLEETINLASNLSVRETDQYAKCVELLLEAKYELYPCNIELCEISILDE